MEGPFLPAGWNIDQITEALEQHGVAIIDDAYSLSYMHQLNQECTARLSHFRQAAIQHGMVSNIRSDHILWINDSFPLAGQHIQSLKALSQQLNQYFYLGIQDVEAHFACYHPGEFYARHRDNPHHKNNRVISTVYYLHDNWQEDWGGTLHLQDKQGQWHDIQPQPNRLALFQSNLLHEVIEARHQRLSITAWLRSGSSLF
ncbi:2OG-Fe(II) oxygenase [Acinetobacter sp. WZC-1]|uniref:2OG-Fe(II) oxygenase n=1 Tax=Acinetobacter sp. WZC-1 TaxID=3459034 RepID=UPI00403DE591